MARPVLLVIGLAIVGIAGAFIGQRVVAYVIGPNLPRAEVIAARVRELQEIATARAVVRTIVRGSAQQTGLLVSNTDETLCRVLVTGDYGFDLSVLGPERIELRRGQITVRLPAPQLLAPGFTVSPAEQMDVRTTRWVTDPGPGQLAAAQAARVQAQQEAPQRVAELGIEQDLRAATRRALVQMLPRLLGDPALIVRIDFDDEPVFVAPPPGHG